MSWDKVDVDDCNENFDGISNDVDCNVDNDAITWALQYGHCRVVGLVPQYLWTGGEYPPDNDNQRYADEIWRLIMFNAITTMLKLFTWRTNLPFYHQHLKEN